MVASDPPLPAHLTQAPRTHAPLRDLVNANTDQEATNRICKHLRLVLPAGLHSGSSGVESVLGIG